MSESTSSLDESFSAKASFRSNPRWRVFLVKIAFIVILLAFLDCSRYVYQMNVGRPHHEIKRNSLKYTVLISSGFIRSVPLVSCIERPVFTFEPFTMECECSGAGPFQGIEYDSMADEATLNRKLDHYMRSNGFKKSELFYIKGHRMASLYIDSEAGEAHRHVKIREWPFFDCQE